MDLAALYPLPCCHVSMGMKEGQDVAHSDYLGGRLGKHLVNKVPQLLIRLAPFKLQAHSPLPASLLPLWSWDFAAGLQAGLLVSSTASSPWQQSLRMSTSLSKQGCLLCPGKACSWRPHSFLYPGCLPHTSAQENCTHVQG